MSIEFPAELTQFVESLDRVDILSGSAMSLLRELSAGDMSSKQLAQKISQDPTLSASLLKLANSAYYGIPNKVSTVSHAVSLLGFTAVRNLVQGLCLIDFNQPEVGLKEDATGREFGAHSMAVSKMAGKLTKKFGFPTIGQGEAETAGLLHDIGFLLMAASRKADFEALVTNYKKSQGKGGEEQPSGTRLMEIEREIFGFTHPELGAWLARRWNLPLMIQEALMYHHGDISECLNRESAALIQLANLICNENEMGYIPEGYWGDADPSVLRFLDSQGKLETYDAFPHSIQKEVDEVKKLYEFVVSGMKGAPVAEKKSPEESREKESRSEPKRKIGTSPDVPGWSLLVPGLPHLFSGRGGIGFGLIFLFLVSVAVCAVSLTGGNTLLGFAALAIAGVSWIGSIMSS